MKILSLCLCLLLTFPFSAASLFRRRRLSIVNSKVPCPSPDLDDSAELPAINFYSLAAEVDYSTNAVIKRLKVYINGGDAGAIFCELKGNRAAADIQVFDGIINELFEILHFPPSHEMFLESSSTPVGFVSSVFSIFIKFGVDIAQAEAFKKLSILEIVINKLKSHYRPLLAFFILIRDHLTIHQFARNESVNVYAVNNAILMLPNIRIQMQYLSIIYDNFGAEIFMSQKITPRLFRDSSDIPICQFLVQRGFDPQAYPTLYSSCRLHLDHPKWDYFAEIYGYQPVKTFLESEWHLNPENSGEPRKILPFVLYPCKDSDHPRWALYSLAYSEELIEAFKMNH